jgi:multimeric flavodoxin WrbA
MAIKILGICGSPVKNSNTQLFLEEALKAAREIPDVETELFNLAGRKYLGCIHCNYCALKQKEGDFCSLKDDLYEIYPKMLEADGYLFATPVYITRMSGQMASFLDRMRAIGHGLYYRMRMAGKAGGALAVIWMRNSGGETCLLSMVQAMLLFQVYPVTVGLDSAFGAIGFTSLQGENVLDKENPDDHHLVKRDLFGMKMARKVGSGTAELAKILKTGKQVLLARGEKISLRGFRK